MAKQTLVFEDIQEGDELPPLQKGPITRTQLVKYAGASGDFNPMHHDEIFAKNAGMPSVFAHGMLSMGFLGQLITDWAGNDSLKKLGVRFAAITWPGDVIICKGRVVKKHQQEGRNLVDCELYAENQKGQKTVTGNATVQLSSR